MCTKVGLIVAQSLHFAPADCLANVTLLEITLGSSLRGSLYGQIKTRLVRVLGTAMLCCKRFQIEKVV